jgi:hypothetical protein
VKDALRSLGKKLMQPNKDGGRTEYVWTTVTIIRSSIIKIMNRIQGREIIAFESTEEA